MHLLRTAAALAAAMLGLLLAASAPAAPRPVTASGVDAHLRALAGIAAQHGGNRAAGLPGAEATADYVAARLGEAGWRVERQAVSFPYPFERSAPVLGDLRPGRDVVTVRGSGAVDATGRVRTIFSAGCSGESLRSLRRGEIALLPVTECDGPDAARGVAARGGIAVVFDGGSAEFPLRLATGVSTATPVPMLVVRTRAAIRLSRVRSPIRVRVDAGVERRTAHNVVAELPGTDPRRVVMAGGHLDSVPEGAGINDNGSGLAALLEVAERLPAERRRATVRLGFWTAEEYGLFGSRAYVRGLGAAERRRIAAYLNYDMVGSPNAVVEVYANRDRLGRLLRRTLAGDVGSTQLAADSDHAPFAAAGIPVGGVYTGSLETRRGRPRDRCYHRSCDRSGNADRRLVAKVANGAVRAILELAGGR
jgi:hypothetical protein